MEEFRKQQRARRRGDGGVARRAADEPVVYRPPERPTSRRRPVTCRTESRPLRYAERGAEPRHVPKDACENEAVRPRRRDGHERRDAHGTAAPRLAAVQASTAEFTELWHDLVGTLDVLAQCGLTHGDLSPYNVLVDETRCVLIDLPQVVDLVANPSGSDFLHRDCHNIAEFFARRGVLAADASTLALRLSGLALP